MLPSLVCRKEAESNEPSSAVAVWIAAPRFVNRIVPPTGMLTMAGSNARSTTRTSVTPGSALASGGGCRVGEGGGTLPSGPATRTVPVMSGWMAQRYANVPGLENVRRKVAREAMSPLSNSPPRPATECGATPEFTHVTVDPSGTRSCDGRKAKSTIRTPPGGTAAAGWDSVGVEASRRPRPDPNGAGHRRVQGTQEREGAGRREHALVRAVGPQQPAVEAPVRGRHRVRAAPLFAKVTRVPASTVKSPGTNAKSTISTSPAAGGGAVVGAGVGVAGGGVVPGGRSRPRFRSCRGGSGTGMRRSRPR